MTTNVSNRATQVYRFGPFELHAAERLLKEEGRTLRLGSRAFDILHLLLHHAGRMVTKEEILATIWAGVFVEEANLRVHITALRKVLGDGSGDRRYIVNEPGRGYRFVAPVLHVLRQDAEPAAPAAPTPTAIPTRSAHIIGRGPLVARLAGEVADWRLLTIVGTGGIGKTTVALAVAEAMAAAFTDAIRFIDLAPIAEARLVANTLARVLGLPITSDDETAAILAALRGRRQLLIFDNCEHVINAVAGLAEAIHQTAEGIHILCTSREPLNIAGERVHRLAPLDNPPAAVTRAAAVGAYPAVELFVERAASQTDGFKLTDANAPLVAEICRRLDGLPFAIELAAGRVDVLGVKALAARLEDRFQLLTRGRRTALPRQQTLRLTLDWSHDLLPPAERVILRRLGIFAGSFTLGAAERVASDPALPPRFVVEALANLVDKSMVAADTRAGELRYRLLDTIRAYAREHLAGASELARFSARHAENVIETFERFRADHPDAPMLALQADLDDVRYALAWAFSPEGDVPTGIRLVLAVALLFIDLSLLVECTSWTRRALDALDETEHGGRREMELTAYFAMPLLYTQGNSEIARQALEKADALAERLGDNIYQAQSLDRLYIFHLRAGHFRELARIASRAEALAPGSFQGQGRADWMAGIGHFAVGELAQARSRFERALFVLKPERSAASLRGVADGRVFTLNTYAQVLWMQGFADRADKIGWLNRTETEALGPVLHSQALTWTIRVVLWRGELERAAALVDQLLASAERAGLAPTRLVGQALLGVITSLKGDPTTGITLLHDAITALRKANYGLVDIALMTHLGEAFMAAQRWDEAMATVKEALTVCDAQGYSVNMPALLQLKAEIILARTPSSTSARAAAQACLETALEWAQRQGARAYALRILNRMMTMRTNLPCQAATRATLRTLYEGFTEGFDTVDLREAARLLKANS